MVSEDQARDLLARAGATIEVDEHAPMTLTGLPDGRVRRWPALVAIAASVAVIAGVGYGAARLTGDGVSGFEPAASHEPVEQEHVYGAGEMPSLAGYSRDEAIEELNARGLLATIDTVPGECLPVPEGHVFDAKPAQGTTVEPGQTVIIRVVTGRPGDFCAPPPRGWEEIFELLRFARGLGAPPDLPDPVSVGIGDGRFVELSREEAVDPSSWTVCGDDGCHSPLMALAELATRPVAINGRYLETHVVPTNDPPDDAGSCLTRDPHEQALPYHRATFVQLSYPSDFTGICPVAPVLQVGWTEDHRIAAVRLRLPLETDDSDITEPELEASLDRIVAAQDFVTWARSEGPAPDFADRVRNFQSGFSPPWNTEPESRQTWSGCSGAGLACWLNPVGAIARFRGDIEVDTGPSGCGPTPDFGSAQDVVHLASRVNPACRGAVVVELWIDDEGRVYGVRQVNTAAY